MFVNEYTRKWMWMFHGGRGLPIWGMGVGLAGRDRVTVRGDLVRKSTFVLKMWGHIFVWFCKDTLTNTCMPPDTKLLNESYNPFLAISDWHKRPVAAKCQNWCILLTIFYLWYLSCAFRQTCMETAPASSPKWYVKSNEVTHLISQFSSFPRYL